MIQFETTILINRPIQEVFTFLSNPLNLPRWQSMVKEVQPASQGTLGKGATFTIKSEMMGQKMEGRIEIVDIEPPSTFAFRNQSGPMSVMVTMNLKPAGAGAQVAIRAMGEPGGMFKLAEPVLAKQVQSQMETNLARLKDYLESGTKA
jgi:carbon monoxide dehydrogenase subunit G